MEITQYQEAKHELNCKSSIRNLSTIVFLRKVKNVPVNEPGN
jgi:hypothetical protein